MITSLILRNTNHVILQFSSREKIDKNWLSSFLKEKTSLLDCDLVSSIPDVAARRASMGTSITQTSYPVRSKPTLSPLRTLSQFFATKTSKSHNTFLLKRAFVLFSKKSKATSRFQNDSYPILTIHFLKKERLYTKLKYSRSPAYDIVSGGAAALLAGFMCFLISEKYGFELVDSGDFYYLFMYIVFLAFSVRPLLTSFDVKYNLFQIFSLRLFKDFYLNLLYLAFYNFKR